MEKYAKIVLTDRTGVVNGLPISLFIEELKKLPQDSLLYKFRETELDGHFYKLLSFNYLTKNE